MKNTAEMAEQHIDWQAIEVQAKNLGWTPSEKNSVGKRVYSFPPKENGSSETSGQLTLLEEDNTISGDLSIEYQNLSEEGVKVERTRVTTLQRRTTVVVESRVRQPDGYADAVQVTFQGTGGIDYVKTSIPRNIVSSDQRADIAQTLFRRIVPSDQSDSPLKIQVSAEVMIEGARRGLSPVTNLIFTSR